MKHSLLRRGLSLLLCLSILLGISVARPQRAEAFAISASLVASVIMIMTACGVTFWASTQGDAESYISQKLGEYLDLLNPSPASVLDWLGIDDLGQLFVVLSGGIVRFDSNVANPILDFIRWFNQDEGIVSDGEVVTDASTGFSYILAPIQVGSFSVAQSDSSFSAFTVSLSDFGFTSSTGKSYAVLSLPSDFSASSVTFQLVRGDSTVDNPAYIAVAFSSSDAEVPSNGYFSSNYGIRGYFTFSVGDIASDSRYLWMRFVTNSSTSIANGSCTFTMSGIDDDVGTPGTYAIAPSSAVSVPANVSDDDSFDVAPSVALSDGMSVDDASSAIFDGVTSADGLTSTGEAVEPPAFDLSGILEILGSILNAILAIPGHIAALPSAIASAFNSILSSIKSVLDSIADKVTSAAESIIDGINAKLDNFIYEMEYGFSAVVSSIHRIGQDVRDALMTWLDDFITDVQSGISTIKQTVIGIPQAISQGAQDVITGIQSLPQLISDALVNLFVPDEAYIGEFVASLHVIFDNRFSILSYPFSILGEFITRASGIDEDEPILRWPDIYEPFSGQLLIGAGSYNLNQIRQGNFAQAHGLYMVVVKGFISFEFLGFLYSWFCSVFKMREDDFASPLEDYDGGDDY